MHLSVNIGVALAACLVAVLLIETTLRIYGITTEQDRLSVYEFDSTLGWRTRKSFRFFRSSRYYAHFTYYNLDGFPTDEKNWLHSPDRTTPSIAIIGDSFVEGYYLPYEFTFSHIIDDEIADRQVINLGVSGYSPDQYLLQARRHLNKYHVTDIVVMFFPANDIPYLNKDTYYGYAKPLFLSTSFETPINVPLSQRQEARGVDVLHWLTNHSALYTLMRPFVQQFFTESDINYVAPKFQNEEMERAVAFINQIHLEFPKASFSLYYIPTVGEIAETQTLQHNLTLFYEICSEYNMACYSPETIFSGIDPELIYTPGDGHFTELGASLVADHLYYLLTQSK